MTHKGIFSIGGMHKAIGWVLFKMFSAYSILTGPQHPNMPFDLLETILQANQKPYQKRVML